VAVSYRVLGCIVQVVPMIGRVAQDCHGDQEANQHACVHPRTRLGFNLGRCLLGGDRIMLDMLVHDGCNVGGASRAAGDRAGRAWAHRVIVRRFWDKI
jgi:hypothetical protein